MHALLHEWLFAHGLTKGISQTLKKDGAISLKCVAK